MSELRRPTALVIDHLNLFSQSIRPTLMRRGFQVFCAKTPDRGMSLYQKHQAKIDMVVIDVATPASGNLDLAADLERGCPTLPILYLVGAGHTIMRCSIEAHTPGAVLVTPFTEEQLLERVSGLLEMEVAKLAAPEEDAWERLAASSERILCETAILYIYEQRQAALAASHVETLRADGIRHAFRRTNCDAAPFGIVVGPRDVIRARILIERAAHRARLNTAA
jgi:DNA-binding NtrC family response regulator